MEEKTVYLLLCTVLIVILIACFILLARVYSRLTGKNEMLRESLANLERLNDRLRMERHDYLNHLQVVYGLMELEEYDEMNAYLRKVYRELLKTGKAIKTSRPAVNALLAAKSAEADAKGIEMQIEVKSDLKDLRIEDWELCKVLSNLIDNAMRALAESPGPERKLRINVTETADRYIFDVENNGPRIPDEFRPLLFKKGFTTKKGEGHGMGLSIVTEILEANKGSLEYRSEEEETVFTVLLEKGE